MSKLTQAILKEELTYDPETGKFFWKTKRKGRAQGSEAGTLTHDGYVVIKIFLKIYRAHRLAFLYMEGAFPQDVVDHKNHIRNDNRWSNLRPATHSENQANRKVASHNKLGIKGVRWVPSKGKYRAEITLGDYYRSAYFYTVEEAKAAYEMWALELNGEFAYSG